MTGSDSPSPPPANPGRNPLEQADIAAAASLARRRHDPALRIATAFAKAGDQGPLLAAAGAVLAGGLFAGDHGLVRRGAHLAAAVLATTAFKAVIKRAVSRTRPNVLLDHGVYAVEPFGPDTGPRHSFPSGHTAGSVAAARACARCWPGTAPLAYAAAAAVAAVQVPRGAHFPSDVLAGTLLGLLAQALAEHIVAPG